VMRKTESLNRGKESAASVMRRTASLTRQVNSRRDETIS
jgi:hypothetical protein